jgi:hypothetical protein
MLVQPFNPAKFLIRRNPTNIIRDGIYSFALKISILCGVAQTMGERRMRQDGLRKRWTRVGSAPQWA